MVDVAQDPKIRVTVVFSPGPRQVREVALELDAGADVALALRASGLTALLSDLPGESLAVGVWGVKASPGQVLRDLDRVEIYRPLTVDPKVARRMRFVKQGTRAAGLFLRQRPQAKAGY